ncbi:16709_t:CDS:2 [Rhizophagus irregularis]|nr:16709_t:CDS:2 [Rhizophagus irregularis]
MEIIEILDEEIYDVNKDAQIIQNKEDKNSLKRKYGQSKIQSIDENIYEFESDNSQSKKVDIEEIRLPLRKAVAEVEAIEIANEKAKLALKND